MWYRDFPGSPWMVKNLSSKAGHLGSIPDEGTMNPSTVGQLSLCNTTKSPHTTGRILHAPTKILRSTTKKWHSQTNIFLKKKKMQYIYKMECSVQFSRSVVSNSSQSHELQHARPPCPSPTPGVYSNSCPSSRWCIQPSHPLSSPSPPTPNPSQHQGLFQWVNSSHEVDKVLEFQLQHQSFQWTPRTDIL